MWMPDNEDVNWHPNPRECEVFVSDNDAIRVLLGPSGEVVAALYERPKVRFGYQPKERSRVSRLVRFDS